MSINTNIPYSIAQNAGDFLLGLSSQIKAATEADTKQKLEKLAIVEKLEADFRDIYDRFIPNVHVVDTENYFRLTLKGMKESPKLFIENEDTEYLDKIITSGTEEHERIKAAFRKYTADYHAKLLAKQGRVTNPIKHLNELSLKLFNRTREISNSVSARYLGAEFSKQITAVFGNNAVLAAIDPEISSDPNTYIFFSSSFAAIVAAFKNNVASLIEKEIKDVLAAGFNAQKSISIGSVVNAGHAAVQNELGSYVNSPAMAKALFGVGSGRSKRFSPSQLESAAATFKQESRIIDNYITVSKDFTTSGKFGVLLALGVTITIPEDAAENRVRGASTEARAISSFDIAPIVPRTRSERNAVYASLAKRAFKKLSENITKGRSSRSIDDFIQDVIADTLTGKKTSRESSKKKVSSKTTVKMTVVDSKAKPLKFPKPVPPSVTKQGKVSPIGREGSLASLQSLLSASIRAQVEKNMGKGNAKNVLNFRTGRFAESVRVERLSKSREGMITAFYSYMRNPYATFSEGGRQQYPKTRDPKLLIAKSIREIAAAAAYTRMRSVLV